MKNFGWDVDGVLANFNERFIEALISQTGRDLFPPRPFDIPTWDYPQHYGYTEAEVKDFWRMINEPNSFWMNLNPYPWTMEVLDKLHTMKWGGANIYFITNRPGYFAKLQTENWLKYHGFDKATVLLAADKGIAAKAFDLDFYIDDNIPNLQNVVTRSTKTKTYRQDQPWNRGVEISGVETVSSPLEIPFLKF